MPSTELGLVTEGLGGDVGVEAQRRRRRRSGVERRSCAAERTSGRVLVTLIGAVSYSRRDHVVYVVAPAVGSQRQQDVAVRPSRIDAYRTHASALAAHALHRSGAEAVTYSGVNGCRWRASHAASGRHQVRSSTSGSGSIGRDVGDGGQAAVSVAEDRMRWSYAPSIAVEPAPIATTICLNGSVVQSPAANTPGAEV